MLEWCIKKFVWQETTITFSSSTFDFNPEGILNRSIQSDLKKKNCKEKILDRIIKKMSKDGNYYIEHREGTKAFPLKR